MHVSVEYICASGGSGITTMELCDIPEWLAQKPGTLIHNIYPSEMGAYEKIRKLRTDAIKQQAQYL